MCSPPSCAPSRAPPSSCATSPPPGIAVCVASQGSLRKTDRSLALTGLDPLFAPAARFSAEQVPRGKPHPDLFLHRG